MMSIAVNRNGGVAEEASAYISGSRRAKLPADVVRKAKHHILDTLAAIVSGSQLSPGQLAKKHALSQGGVPEALVLGSEIIAAATTAAFANGIMAHADETDDSHAKSFTHPGCAIVPAALAMAEKAGADGTAFLEGVVVGYEIGCRVTQALGVDNLRHSLRSTHSIGGIFGAAAAAAAISRLNDKLVRYVLSYAAQQASGITYWVHDDVHVEKAFVFGGMPARNGVNAALLIESGFSGVLDPFSGERNFFDAFSPKSNPGLLTKDLGSLYEIMATNIKKYSVGSPIQAPLDALLILIEKHGLKYGDIKSIVARLGDRDAAFTVSNRSMPDINLPYILAVTLMDGGLTFEAAHAYERMKEPTVLELMKRITAVDDPQLAAAKIMRQGIVELTTKDGAQFREHVVSVRGTAENPMTTEDVENKCRELLTPVIGSACTEELILKVWNIEQVQNMRQLRPLLSAAI